MNENGKRKILSSANCPDKEGWGEKHRAIPGRGKFESVSENKGLVQ